MTSQTKAQMTRTAMISPYISPADYVPPASAAELLTRYAADERYFVGAVLRDANLRGAYLTGANLRDAVLRDANLRGAVLTGAYLPAPTMVLLAAWGGLPDDLTLECMRWDASAHPDPTAFDRWATGGPCPYATVRVQRIVEFCERKELWVPGSPSMRLYDLMCAILREKCRGWE